MNNQLMQEGSEVKILGTNLRGRVIKYEVRTKLYSIDVEGKILKVSQDKLKLVSTSAKHTKLSSPKPTLRTSKKDRITLDLHGLTREQTIKELLMLLDKALLCNATSLEIIHGHGTGILKKVVHEFLSESNYISSYKLHENNTGTTIAFLK